MRLIFPQDREIIMPIELMLMVAKYLSKADIKALRLVSRDFYSFYKTVPLITELWFSRHPEDLSVFNEITSRPDLAQHITTILYDRIQFASPFQFLDRTQAPEIDPSDEIPILAAGMRQLPKVSHVFFLSSVCYMRDCWFVGKGKHAPYCARENPNRDDGTGATRASPLLRFGRKIGWGHEGIFSKEQAALATVCSQYRRIVAMKPASRSPPYFLLSRKAGRGSKS